MKYKLVNSRDVTIRKSQLCIKCRHYMPAGTKALFRSYESSVGYLSLYMHQECHSAIINSGMDGWDVDQLLSDTSSDTSSDTYAKGDTKSSDTL